jgi:DNA-binding transcriptional regulator YiaG
MADLNLTDGGEGALGISKSESWREAHRNAVKRGEDHCWSKLNWDQVRTIRNLRSVQYVPDRDLAVQYGVSHQTISDVLHNEVWKDPDYDSSAVIRDSSGENAHNVRMTWGSVREVRTIRQREYRTLKNLAEGYNVSPDMIRLILLNKNWIDPNYDPSKMVSR